MAAEPEKLVQPAAGQIIGGRYELVSELGRGGMGSVWRARNVALEASCAIKFMHAELASKDDLRKRFVREARAAAQLSSPHIVSVFDVGDSEGRPFMAMELMSGESLESRLERERKLSIDVTLEIIGQVARGLETAHAADLVHRDLKPENIFLLSGSRIAAKILDFGVAKHLEATSGVKTVTGALLGTPYYMSPEQVRGESDIDRRSDVWALGIVAFECLTGTLPFSATSLPALLGAILHGEIPDIGIPALEPFWRRASQRDREQRFQSAGELADGLRDAAQRMAAQTQRPSQPSRLSVTRPSDGERYRRLPMRSDARVFGVGVGIGVLLLGAWFVAPREPNGPAIPGTPHKAEAAVVGAAAVVKSEPGKAELPQPPRRAIETGIEIDSVPSGASVVIDGAPLGLKTPVRLTALTPGEHRITLEHADYQPFSVAVFLRPGSVIELPDAKLEPFPKATGLKRTPPREEQPDEDETLHGKTTPPPTPPKAPKSARPRLGKYDELIGF